MASDYPKQPAPDDWSIINRSSTKIPGFRQRRKMTGGEIEMCRKYYKNSIRYEEIWVYRNKVMPFQPDGVAITPKGHPHFPSAIYLDDFSVGKIKDRGLFIHELAHVWQFQNNVIGSLINLGIKNMLNYSKRDSHGMEKKFLYEYHFYYEGINGAYLNFRHYGMEQQAAIIEDYYYLINDFGTVSQDTPGTIDQYHNPEYGILRHGAWPTALTDNRQKDKTHTRQAVQSASEALYPSNRPMQCWRGKRWLGRPPLSARHDEDKPA